MAEIRNIGGTSLVVRVTISSVLDMFRESKKMQLFRNEISEF